MPRPGREEPKAETEWATPEPTPTTLTIPIGSALGKQLVEALTAQFGTQPTEDPAPEPVAETTPVEPAPAEPAVAPEPEAPAEPVDAWAALTAHLTQDEPDAWSVLVSNLTTTASSSAATEA